jgi:hypothetical protein
MAWIFFQDTAELKTHFEDLSVPLPIAKLSEELSAFFCVECGRATLASRLYGTMCALCGKGTLLSQSTSSQVAFLARTSALLALEALWKESQESYSLKSSECLASFDHDSFSWRTSQLSLFGGLTEFSWSSLEWGTIVDGRLYQPQKLEPVTCERESGFLDTPTVSTATYRTQGIPTPTATAYGRNRTNSKGAMIRLSLSGMALAGILPGHPKGSLNPEWTEQAMGLVIGATDLEPWATDGCRKQREKRSNDCLQEKV